MSAYQPSDRNAGNRRVARGVVVQRMAALLAADPELPIEDAWGFVTGGMHLGKWKTDVATAVKAELASVGRGEP